MDNFRDKIKFVPKDKYKPKFQKTKDFPYYKMYEEDGSFVGRINPKYEVRQNKWLQGVSCFVMNEQGEILLEKRAGKGLTPGKIDLVSGHVDKEETPEQSMSRELQEEVGIAVTKNSQLRSLGVLPLVFENNNNRRKFKIEFFCCQYNNETMKMQKEEVEDVFWLPMEDVFELIKRGKTKFTYTIQMEEIFQKIGTIKNMNKERE